MVDWFQTFGKHVKYSALKVFGTSALFMINLSFCVFLMKILRDVYDQVISDKSSAGRIQIWHQNCLKVLIVMSA